MSHGQSSCRLEMVDLVKVSDLLFTTIPDSRGDCNSGDNCNYKAGRNSPDNQNPSDDFTPDLPDVQMSSPSCDSVVVDTFHNASQVAGVGTTFMDVFNNDRFSEV